MYKEFWPYAPTSPTSPRFTPFPCPPNCVLSFFFLFVHQWQHSSRKLPLSAAINCQQFLARGGTSYPPPLSMLGFGARALSFPGACPSCCEFICAAALPCPEDPASSYSFTTSVSHRLSRSSSNDHWALGGDGEVIDAPFRAEYSAGSYSLHQD